MLLLEQANLGSWFWFTRSRDSWNHALIKKIDPTSAEVEQRTSTNAEKVWLESTNTFEN